jgi:N-formylglutamate amidohydrolase
MDDEFPPWFERLGPSFAATPLVLAIPHAGRFYPEALLADSAVPRAMLEDLEDRHADLLVTQAVEEGAVAIVARAARAWIDLNRGEEDLDPALRDPPGSGPPMTMRARGGLGLVPHRLGRHALWQRAPSPHEVAERIAAVHEPYHAAIAAALTEACRYHGFAVLLDCHSMPRLRGSRPAQIVIGDRHGTSAGAGIAAALAQVARVHGFTVALNAPYAGAHSTERHGRPADNVHAIQLEIDRTSYLKPDMRTVSHGLNAIRRLVSALGARALAAARPGWAVAAE